jgi:hypothetical protein
MNEEIRLIENFDGPPIPRRAKTPVMSEAEQRERHGHSVADVEAAKRQGESFVDAARRLGAERQEEALRAASKPKPRPTPEELYRKSVERDRKVLRHLRERNLPMSAYTREARLLRERGELD